MYFVILDSGPSHLQILKAVAFLLSKKARTSVEAQVMTSRHHYDDADDEKNLSNETNLESRHCPVVTLGAILQMGDIRGGTSERKLMSETLVPSHHLLSDHRIGKSQVLGAASSEPSRSWLQPRCTAWCKSSPAKRGRKRTASTMSSLKYGTIFSESSRSNEVSSGDANTATSTVVASPGSCGIVQTMNELTLQQTPCQRKPLCSNGDGSCSLQVGSITRASMCSSSSTYSPLPFSSSPTLHASYQVHSRGIVDQMLPTLAATVSPRIAPLTVLSCSKQDVGASCVGDRPTLLSTAGRTNVGLSPGRNSSTSTLCNALPSVALATMNRSMSSDERKEYLLPASTDSEFPTSHSQSLSLRKVPTSGVSDTSHVCSAQPFGEMSLHLPPQIKPERPLLASQQDCTMKNSGLSPCHDRSSESSDGERIKMDIPTSIVTGSASDRAVACCSDKNSPTRKQSRSLLKRSNSNSSLLASLGVEKGKANDEDGCGSLDTEDSDEFFLISPVVAIEARYQDSLPKLKQRRTEQGVAEARKQLQVVSGYISASVKATTQNYTSKATRHVHNLNNKAVGVSGDQVDRQLSEQQHTISSSTIPQVNAVMLPATRDLITLPKTLDAAISLPPWSPPSSTL